MKKKSGVGKKAIVKSVFGTAVSFLVLLFSVFFGGGVVFGWFHDNRVATVGGMNLTMSPNDLKVSFFVYAYDVFGEHAEGASEYYTFYDEASGETASVPYSINDLKMNPYDMIFIHRNDLTPVVVRIAVSGENTLPENGEITVNLSRDLTKDETSLDYFSSVVKFSCVKGAGILGETAAETFDNVAGIVANGSPLGKDYFKTAQLSSTVKAFFYESGGEYFKHSDVSFTVSYSKADFNGDVLNLYLYFDYDKTRIEDFILNGTGGGASFTDNELYAQNDLTEIYARI